MKSWLLQLYLLVWMCCITEVTFGQNPDVKRNIFVGASAIVSSSGGFDADGRPVPPVFAESPWRTAGIPGDVIVASDILTKGTTYTGRAGANAGIMEASAFGTLGSLNARARVTGRVEDSLNLTAQSSAFTADELTWFAPGRAKLTVVVPIIVRGTAKATLSESPGRIGGEPPPPNQFVRASFRAVAQANDSFSNQFIAAAVKENSANFGTTIAPGNFELKMDVVPGRPILYSLSVTASAGANLINGCLNCTPDEVHRTSNFSGIADFGHTLYWGGVESVTDALTGEPVLDWSMRSLSGVDYTRSFETVPEPSAFVLLACGLATSLSARRAVRWRTGLTRQRAGLKV